MILVRNMQWHRQSRHFLFQWHHKACITSLSDINEACIIGVNDNSEVMPHIPIIAPQKIWTNLASVMDTSNASFNLVALSPSAWIILSLGITIYTCRYFNMILWRACNLTAFTPCLTGPGDYPFASRHKGPRFKSPGGYLCETGISTVSNISLHWWPRCDWSFLWPRLRRASSRTVTRPSYRQCENLTWSYTALLSWFHARCRSSFQLHNWHSRLLGGRKPCGEPAISLHSHHVSLVQQTTRLHPVTRDPGSSPQGVLMWNWDSSC